MKLERRERYMIWGVSLFMIFVFVLQFIIFPFFERKARLKRAILSKKKALDKILELQAEYRAHEHGLKEILKRLKSRDKGFTLFSFLEKEAGKAGIKDHIKYMKPSAAVERVSGSGYYNESGVEMKLTCVSLDELVTYLFKIESPKELVKVKRVSINKSKEEMGFLDAILQVVTFEPVQR